MALAGLLNAAWFASCLPEAARFHRATRRVAQTQERVLGDILLRNRDSEFGRKYGFQRLRTADEFRAAVPLSSAGDYGDAIERIASGTAHVLTTEPVILLEPTGGSTGGEQLIPSTRSLRRQFQRALAAWSGASCRRVPA